MRHVKMFAYYLFNMHVKGEEDRVKKCGNKGDVNPIGIFRRTRQNNQSRRTTFSK